MIDWDTRRHLKMADVIGRGTAQSQTDSQESGEGTDCTSSCLPLVRHQHANRGTRRGADLIPLRVGAEGTEITQYFLWGLSLFAYSCFIRSYSQCLLT